MKTAIELKQWWLV